MKKRTLLTLLVLSHMATLAVHAQHITVKGEVSGIKKGRLYLLTPSSEEQTDTLGFCDFKRGKFTLKATAKEPVMARLVVDGYEGGFAFFAEPGTTYQAHLSEDENYYLRGGALNDSYTAHMKASDEMQTTIAGLQERYDSLRTAKKFRSASLVNDTLHHEQERLKNHTMSFLAGNDNLITAYTIYSNIVRRDAGLREARSMYASLGEGAKASQYGRLIKERIDRLAQTDNGAKAPDFTLNDPAGNPITMSEVKGKIKIVDFWASWCGPCRLNNPALKAMYEEYHNKGLEIIGVSLDNNKAAWEKAIEKDGLPWIQVSSLKGWNCETARQYNVTGIPAIFILDEYNNIMATGLKGDQLKAFLEENLK